MILNYKSILLFVTVLITGALYTSCSDDSSGGQPRISYIRITDPGSSDSLLAEASQGATIAIVGENLQETRQLWINDQRATLIPTYMSSTSIIVTVPSESPTVVTDKMKLIFANGDSLLYDFHVHISKPLITSMDCEYVPVGSVATIRGDFFYKPVSVAFEGGVLGEIISVEDKAITVRVPEGAVSGPITVTTNFGKTTSVLNYWDKRNIILNYDDLNANGSWRPGTIGTDDGIEGNYLILRGKLDKNQKTEDYANGGFVSEFWAKANGRPDTNLVPDDYENYSLKFEAKVIDWYGSYLNLCFAPWDQSNNGEYWGNLNAKAIWGPWDAGTTNYKTKDWITVTIPLTEFRYKQEDKDGNVVYTEMKLNPSITGSLTFWVVGSPLAKPSPVEVYIDNVRIVSNK